MGRVTSFFTVRSGMPESVVRSAGREGADTEHPVSTHGPETDAVDVPAAIDNPPTPSRRAFLTTVAGTAGMTATMNGASRVMAEQPNEDRFERGLRILRRIGGTNYDGPIIRSTLSLPVPSSTDNAYFPRVLLH
jgi:hypothetical protein